MWRTLIVATAIYACGHPSLDGYRPSAFERPLRSFHAEVNQFAHDGRRALNTLDDARPMRYLKSYIGHMNEMLDRNG